MFINESLIAKDDEKKRLGAAVGWLAEQNQPHDIKQIQEASQRFDLSPLNEDFLIRQFIHQN